MKKSAFSLVELLITITIVSLIIGVTAPVFTKKLHANSTIVGASESKKEPRFDCSGEDFYLLKKEDSGLEYDLCITKYNILTAGTEMAMTDEQISSAGVTFVEAGTNCEVESKKCCWGKGNTATSGSYTADSTKCSEKNGYSGCYRINCDWDASSALCSNYNYDGRIWRLPTPDELSKFNTVTLRQNINLCDYVNDSNYASCSQSSSSNDCPGCHDASCISQIVWTNATSGSNATYYQMGNNEWNKYSSSQGLGVSVRCVTPMTDEVEDSEPPFICEGDNCYTEVGNLLVTTMNIGDSPDLTPTSTSVTTVNSGEFCDSANGAKCCWKGETADPSTCNSKNGYSGCTRTACNWSAGNELCSKLTLASKSWRLPTKAELATFGADTNTINKLNLCEYSGNNNADCSAGGTCDNGSGIATYCAVPYLWSSTVYEYEGSPHYSYHLYDSSWREEPWANYMGSSVRCVTCKDDCPSGQVHNENCECVFCYERYGDKCNMCNNTECTGCENGYSLQNGICTISGDCSGNDCYEQIGKLLVTKFNAGDATPLSIPNELLEIDMCHILSTSGTGNPYCEENTKSCWTGQTSNDECSADEGGYSGCNRTVCTLYAAKEICSELSLGGKSWRLPTKEEAQNFASLGTDWVNKLRLCTDSEEESSAICTSTNHCISQGSYDYCLPYCIWTEGVADDEDDTGEFCYWGSMKWSWFDWSEFEPTSGLSTRCVACATICDSNQYLDNSCDCQNCTTKYGEGCDSCNKDYCLQCKNGYGPEKYASGDIKTCSACTTANCLRCASGPSTCSQCEEGYYKSGSNCLSCSSAMTGCATCTSSSVCKTCKEGYNLKDGHCCASGKYWNGSSCANCYTYYNGSTNVSPCNTCTSSSSNKCTSCKEGYYLSGSNTGTCTACVAGCKTCTSSGCTECQYGPVMSGNICCSAGCESCTAYQSCTTCKAGYTKYSYSQEAEAANVWFCQLANCTTINSTDGTCSVCNTGYTLTNGVCIKNTSSGSGSTPNTGCPDNCSGCTLVNGYTSCTGCLSGYSLYYPDSYAESLGVQFCSTNSGCAEGYTRVDGVCVPN